MTRVRRRQAGFRPKQARKKAEGPSQEGLLYDVLLSKNALGKNFFEFFRSI